MKEFKITSKHRNLRFSVKIFELHSLQTIKKDDELLFEGFDFFLLTTFPIFEKFDFENFELLKNLK